MADKRFFGDDILRLEAWALVKAAERSSHSQPVHDCRILLLSDNLSFVLCFNRGRSRAFRLLTQIRRFASVHLARNIRISIRWIPSEFNSSDRGSREHDSENDASKSLVDHLGSNDGQTFPVSHTKLSRELGSCEYKAFAASDGVAIERTKPSVPRQKRRRTLCAPSWPGTRNKGPKRPNLLTIEHNENQAPPQSAFDAFGQRGREADGASSFVSGSDEEKESAGRVRVLQGRGRARVRELVKTAERMPEEAKRPSARPWRKMRHPSANSATGAGCWQTAMWRLCHKAWEGEKLLAPLLLANFLVAGGKSTGSKLLSPQRMEKGVSESFGMTAQRPSGPQGLAQNDPRVAQTRTLGGHGLEPRPQFHEKTTKDSKTDGHLGWERGKNAKFWTRRPSGPAPFGPSGPRHSSLHPSFTRPLGHRFLGPAFPGFGPYHSGPHPLDSHPLDSHLLGPLFFIFLIFPFLLFVFIF